MTKGRQVDGDLLLQDYWRVLHQGKGVSRRGGYTKLSSQRRKVRYQRVSHGSRAMPNIPIEQRFLENKYAH